jgi:hypothetical protein
MPGGANEVPKMKPLSLKMKPLRVAPLANVLACPESSASSGAPAMIARGVGAPSAVSIPSAASGTPPSSCERALSQDQDGAGGADKSRGEKRASEPLASVRPPSGIWAGTCSWKPGGALYAEQQEYYFHADGRMTGRVENASGSHDIKGRWDLPDGRFTYFQVGPELVRVHGSVSGHEARARLSTPRSTGELRTTFVRRLAEKKAPTSRPAAGLKGILKKANIRALQKPKAKVTFPLEDLEEWVG